MAEVGYGTVLLALIVSVYAAVAALVGQRRGRPELVQSAHNGVLAVAGLTSVAAAILLYLLLALDFRVQYVYEHVSSHLAPVYRVSAFWAGQEGSFLLWLWFLAVMAVIVVWQEEAWDRRLHSHALAVLAFTEAFFALVIVTLSNPFATLPMRLTEGAGLLPLLENPGMIFHPPTLFLGYAGYTVPFAFAVAALLTGQLDDGWLRGIRRWSLFAWLSLGIGILLGAWWAYVELGWGGYWAWDPVENAALIPWLVGTAFLHSVMMQERRGMFKVWNMVLAILAFVLCIFATFVTRGGVILSDLHGFASSVLPITYYLLTFMAVTLFGPLALLYYRRQQLADDNELKALFSRESGFLFGNLLFCGMALAVFLGTVFPTLTLIGKGERVALDASFYNRTSGPLAMTLMLLIGICPVLAWRRATTDKLLRGLAYQAVFAFIVAVGLFALGIREPYALLAFAVCAFVTATLASEFYRGLLARRRAKGESYLVALGRLVAKGRRRYGGYIVHLAMVLIAIGVTGSSIYKNEWLVSLKPGEEATIGDYTLEYEDYEIEVLNANPETYQSKMRFATTLGVYKAGRKIATLVAEKNNHWLLEHPWVTEVAIRSSLKEDLYVILGGLEGDGLASFQLVINPLVNWLWIGGGLLFVGAAVAMWPSRRSQRVMSEG
ncbi:MAG TPA: heme lyase CcmF/NrfE family subunit [Anaerolineae bacterium]|nr:heme lyase CcmF/NrfE family subunit [Anaerolineae bacterium]